MNEVKQGPSPLELAIMVDKPALSGLYNIYSSVKPEDLFPNYNSQSSDEVEIDSYATPTKFYFLSAFEDIELIEDHLGYYKHLYNNKQSENDIIASKPIVFFVNIGSSNETYAKMVT